MEVRSDRTPQPAREQSNHDAPWAPLPDSITAPNPYEAGTLFHGPAFQLLRSLSLAPGASSSLLDAAAGGPPRGLLHEALLDALTHGIPHDRLCDWSPEIPADHVAYPQRIVSLRLFAPLPDAGEVRCEARFAGFDGAPRFPRFQIQAIAGAKVVASLDLVEVLFPKGALGSAPPRDRRTFLRDRGYVPGLRLSHEEGGTTHLAEIDVRASDWLPGTLAQAYAARGDLLVQIAVKEHVAARAAAHPSSVESDAGQAAAGPGSPGGSSLVHARCPSEPLTVRPLSVERTAGTVGISDAGSPTLDLSGVRDWWDRYYRIGRWPVEDIYFGLAGRFVRRVRLEDPAGFAALRGRGVLYLANHQVGIESIIFSLIASGLSGILTVTLAKIEHRTTWLGDLIRHAFAWPGAHDPGVITYFDRSNREELPRIIGVLAREIAGGGKSVMVHVEGTRALSCRAPVQKMSGAFLDMAIATGAPVVPVRFSGGLPVEPLTEKLEYPVGMGGQQIAIGTAILPAELAALPYKERKERVIDAINGLGPAVAEEGPYPPEPAFAAAAEAWGASTGASPEHAALYETLRRLDATGEEVSLLLAGARAGHLVLRDDARGHWLAELARRLYGPHGPAVTVAIGGTRGA
jgi:1-acyl-sn-glycerol-3-phosphate acyltransferase